MASDSTKKWERSYKERKKEKRGQRKPRLIGEMASNSTKKWERAYIADDGESSGAAAAAAAVTLYIMDESRLIGVDLNALDEKMKQLAESAAEDPPYALITCDIDLEEKPYPLNSVLMKHSSKIFLVGGEGEYDGSRDVFEVEPRERKLIPSSEMIALKSKPMVVTIEGSAYVFGIEYGCFRRGDSPSFEVFHPDSNKWEALPDPPFYCTDIHGISEVLDSTFVIGSRIFVVTSFYPPRPSRPSRLEGLHVFNVKSKEWDEKAVNLSSVKESFVKAGLKLPVHGRSVGGFDSGGKRYHVFIFNYYFFFTDGFNRACKWNFYAAIVTGTGTLLCYQDITGAVFPSHMIPARYDAYTSHIQVLGNLSVCTTMYGRAVDLPGGIVCVSMFSLRLAKQLRNHPDPARMNWTSSHTKFLDVVPTKYYVFSVNRVCMARSVLLS
ncbi:hypothetical protein Dimus_019454 [Dionaea muscipula]